MSRKRNRVSVITSRLKAFAIFSDSFNAAFKTSWKFIRGSWSSNSSKAYTATSASDYPLATVKMSKANVTAQIQSTDQGAGIALWVTDSGNWWAVATGTDGATSCNCQTCNASVCNQYATACGSYYCSSSYYVCNQMVNATCQAGYYDSCPAVYCASYNAYNSKNKTGGNCAMYACTPGQYVCLAYNSAYCASSTNTCNQTSCGSYYNYCASAYSYSYSCNCSTCYPPFLRLLQSVSNTVSEVYKWMISATANSLKVITSGTGITAKAYSDNSLSTQIDSDFTYTANGATIETSFGILVAPSSYSQGNSLDEFSISVN